MESTERNIAPATQETYSIVHLRSFKPISLGLPAPGVYRLIMLVLPDLEPSILSRLSPQGSQPASLLFDFGREVSADEFYRFIMQNIDDLQEYHSGFASPFQRSIYQRLSVTITRPKRAGAVTGAENPLEDVPSLKNW